MSTISTTEQFEKLKRDLKRRGMAIDVEAYWAQCQDKKKLQSQMEALQNQRNVISKKIGQMKAQGASIDALRSEMTDIKCELEHVKTAYDRVAEAVDQITLTFPNPLDESVPQGQDESDNKVIGTWSKPKVFDFDILDHVDLGERLNQMHFEKAADVAQSRFLYLSNGLAMLHRALAQWMINHHIHHNHYTEMQVPLLVNAQALMHTGQLPKFSDDLFFLASQKLALIPTAEVSLVNFYSQTMLRAEDLPIKMVAHSNCFRSEAGSYGQDTRGMIRQHQFEKVELVQLTTEAQSEQAFEDICAQAEEILQMLVLPYQKILKCSGDTGFTASKTIDLEVWIPSQNTYREISSISHCKAFQAQRMKTRYKDAEGKNKKWVHTLNGSGLAIGRTLVAVMENYQRADGSIDIPEVLRPYMHGVERIEKMTG